MTHHSGTGTFPANFAATTSVTVDPINWVQHMPCPEGFTSSHRAVLDTLANLADARDGHRVQRTQREIATESWVSERTCRDVVRDLVAAGLAERERTRRPDGHRGIDIIRLNVPTQPAPGK